MVLVEGKSSHSVDEELKARIFQRVTDAAEGSLSSTAKGFLDQARAGYDQVVWLAKLTSWDTGYQILSLSSRIETEIANNKRRLIGSGAVLAVIVLGLVVWRFTRKRSDQ